MSDIFKQIEEMHKEFSEMKAELAEYKKEKIAAAEKAVEDAKVPVLPRDRQLNDLVQKQIRADLDRQKAH